MNNRRRSSSAFSLVEMLSVIAVIGVIAAIAVPNISQINEAASEAKDRRNAQNLASVCASAQAAGLNFVDGGGDVSATVAAVSSGGTVSGGVFDGAYFGISLSGQEQTRVLPYLSVIGGVLQYQSTGEEASVNTQPAAGPANGDGGGPPPGPPPPPPPGG